MSKTIVGVMGPGEGATRKDLAVAKRLGRLIAEKGWVTLTGGRRAGVMQAALLGAKEAGGLTIGVLPQNTAAEASPAADIRITTGLGEARNVVNVLTSSIVFVCGMSAGTASEVALALKTKRQVILLNASTTSAAFWKSLDRKLVAVASSPEHALKIAERVLNTAPL
ncbi:MAG TPA: cytochrome [Terriglobia bacterium]|nr:cytochrome [Terriglobia bacterium]